ncbi:type II secretion system GspH family protein [Aliivibrio sifiae]
MRLKLTYQRGLTLIESIVGIVILGFALSVLISGVFTSSTTSHQATYQVQAAALGHSVMTDILSRQFDQHSDPNGGQYRCGEALSGMTIPSCTLVKNLGRDGAAENSAITFNDVDDFIGCWGALSECSSNTLPSYQLNQLIDTSSADEYKHFTVEINVMYADIDAQHTAITQYKKIIITLYASQYAKYTFSAYRGNY